MPKTLPDDTVLEMRFVICRSDGKEKTVLFERCPPRVYAALQRSLESLRHSTIAHRKRLEKLKEVEAPAAIIEHANAQYERASNALLWANLNLSLLPNRATSRAAVVRACARDFVVTRHAAHKAIKENLSLVNGWRLSHWSAGLIAWTLAGIKGWELSMEVEEEKPSEPNAD